jgi:hypothetical protein
MLLRLNYSGRENMEKQKESEVQIAKLFCSLQRIPTEEVGEPAPQGRVLLRKGEPLLLQCPEPAFGTDLSS